MHIQIVYIIKNTKRKKENKLQNQFLKITYFYFFKYHYKTLKGKNNAIHWCNTSINATVCKFNFNRASRYDNEILI